MLQHAEGCARLGCDRASVDFSAPAAYLSAEPGRTGPAVSNERAGAWPEKLGSSAPFLSYAPSSDLQADIMGAVQADIMGVVLLGPLFKYTEKAFISFIASS